MRAIILCLVLLLPGIANADSFATAAAAKTFIDRVMVKVATGDIEGGLKQLKPYAIVPPAEFDAMAGQVSLQLPAISQRFGKAIGYEFIREDSAGESVVRLLYLQKFERHAMRWRFLLYKGGDGWVLNTFAYDDRLQDVFLP